MARKIVMEASWRHQNRELPIQVTKRIGCYEYMLKSFRDQFDSYLSHRSRMLVIRIDIHCSEYNGDNAMISRMLDKLKRWLRQHYGMTKMGHMWAREVEKSKKQHYHCALLLDGRLIRYPDVVYEWIDRYWQARDQPRAILPRNPYVMVRRGDTASFNTAFYRISYLAKARGKGYKDQTANNYSVSRIKPADGKRFQHSPATETAQSPSQGL